MGHKRGIPNTLCGNPNTQAVRKINHRPDNSLIVFIIEHIEYKTAIDLEFLHRDVLQVR